MSGKREPSRAADLLGDALCFAAGLLLARGFGRRGACLRVTPDATGARLEVCAAGEGDDEPGALDR
ncbi:MAG TPA: hypothetical protein VFS43_13340 [Polyangiaceae bacterium]|nr:hypothetical protein [Polyangiaceae bacterium]